ncbi:hypothetical protein D3C85_1726570 [compost metagenome]
MAGNDIFLVFNESIVILLIKSVTYIEELSFLIELVFTNPKTFLLPFCFLKRITLFMVSLKIIFETAKLSFDDLMF